MSSVKSRKVKRKNAFKYKDESHLLSLSSIKLNKQRDRRAYMLYSKYNNKRKSARSDDDDGDDQSSSFSSRSFVPYDEICDKVRESLMGKDIDDALIYHFMKMAREEQGINPSREFDKFMYFVTEQMK